MVDLEWYRSFVQVYRVGTVSAAAERLHLTQPAVSQHLAALETALGLSLFDRKPRRMVPTEAGKQLYVRVIAAIETLESVPLKKNKDETLSLRLGAPADFFDELLRTRSWQAEALNCRVEFGLTAPLIDRVAAGELDATIATQKIPHPGLKYQWFAEESFWLVGPPGIQFPEDLLTLESWLKTQTWLAYGAELPIVRRFWRAVFGGRLELNPPWILPDLRLLRTAIHCGLGISVLPDYLCRDSIQRQELTLILEPVPPVTNSIWLAYCKAEEQSPPILKLFEILGG